MPTDGATTAAATGRASPADARLRLFLKHAPAAVAMLDRELRYVAASGRYLRDYGLAEQVIEGVSHYALFPEIPARWREIHQRCLAGATERCEADPFPRADGRLDWIRWEITPWRDDAGEIGGLLLFSEVITAQVEAQKALAAEREKLAVTLRSIGDAVICTDTAAKVTLLNAEAESLTGWTQLEALGRPLDDVFRIEHEDTGRRVPSPVDTVLRDGTTVALANHSALVSRFGRVVPIADSAAPIRDAAGEILGVVLVFRDQRGERAAEQKVRESESMLRTFTDVIPDPIFMKDAEGRFTFANPATAALFGRTPDELVGHDERAVEADPRAAAAIRASDLRVLTSGAAETYEITFPTERGERTFLATKVPHRDTTGKVVGLFGSSRDITDRRRAGEALRRSEERLRALIAASSDMIWVLDAHGVVTFWSPSSTEVLGWTAEEMLGKRIRSLSNPDDVQAIEDATREMMRTPGGTTRFECRHRHKDGTYRVTAVLARNLLHDPAVQGIVANLRDVTDERHLSEQFLQAQKLESLGRLAGGVAHDFNNLLTVILSCSQSLAEDLSAGRTAALEDAQQIYESGERAKDLTGQLLAFARKQVIDAVPIDLNTIVRANDRMLGRLIGEDVALEFTLQPGLWLAKADRAQIQQVLLNLAVNARDAMPRGGRLEIETVNACVTHEQAAHDSERREGDWVRLIVRDTGTGMSEETLAHLFEPFFTTKAHGKGTGLGLSTVYGIVKQAGGHLHVHSREGVGSSFEICLPRARDAELPVSTAPESAPLGGIETILVVEDDDALRAVTVRALRAAGYRVLAAAEAQEALTLVDADLAPLDLLLTDVVMPGLDGKRLAEEVHRRRGPVRTLFVSGYTADVLDGHDAGGDEIALLPKPYTPRTLLSRVRRMLDTGH